MMKSIHTFCKIEDKQTYESKSISCSQWMGDIAQLKRGIERREEFGRLPSIGISRQPVKLFLTLTKQFDADVRQGKAIVTFMTTQKQMWRYSPTENY